MIWNIVDGRKQKYRWRIINAVIENIAHDNSCKDSDQFDEANEEATMYEQRKNISLHEAIEWAEKSPGKLTLYLYNQNDGIR